MAGLLAGLRGHFGPGRFSAPLVANAVVPSIAAISPAASKRAGGITVTITGLNLIPYGNGTLGVTFDGVAATSVVWVDNQTITCTVPVGAETGLVDVVVTSPMGVATLFSGFTYYEPTITSVAPAYGPLAGGTVVTIRGYNFDPLETYTIYFGLSVATNVIVLDSATIKATTPAHAIGFVDITLVDTLLISSTFRNGFQFTLLTRGNDIRRTPGITINDALNNAPNSCAFRVDGNSNAPLVGEKIEIRDTFDGNLLLFAGTVQSSTHSYEEIADQPHWFWDVRCVDFTWLFNRKRPFGFFNGVSVSKIVEQLVAKYAPGFTTAHVQQNLAKVSMVLDGSKDLATVMTDLARAIGGGHWYADYTQDFHFFHVVPPNFAPPVTNFVSLGAHLDVVQDALIPILFSYTPGYYIFRHTCVWSDGTETALGAIANPILLDGLHQLSFSNLPTPAAIGTLTCTARRIYYHRLNADDVLSPIETTFQFCQVNDNVTVAFTTYFGILGASVATVIAIPADTVVPNSANATHPPGAATSPGASVNPVYGNGIWNGGAFAFKFAYIYRDGSVSFPSKSSPTVSKLLISGEGLGSFNITDIAPGPTINGVDCVARLVYYSQGVLSNPNFSINWGPGTQYGDYPPPTGFAWPIPFLDATWTKPHVGGVWVLPDNTTTSLANVRLGSAAALGYTIGLFGRSNLPYDNGSNPLSIDPIPIWPNPDGPSLEDVDPPTDLVDTNSLLLKESPFTVSTDLSQVRNRIFVIGAGSTVANTAVVNDTQIQVLDIASFSPTGGKLKIEDPGTGLHLIASYSGVAGVVGQTYVTLTTPLTQIIAQGATICNFFQADDYDSQKFLAKAELDVNGKPTDGIHEYTIVDTSLKATFQLYMRAFAELELFSHPIVQITYSTRDPKSKSGQMVHADMNNPPCQGDFLIQSVTIDQIHDESDALLPRYNVTASSVRFELNDLLLQIISGQIGGGGTSGAGIVAASFAQTSTNSSGTGIPKPTNGRTVAWTTLQPANFGSPVNDNNGWTIATASTGTAAAGFVDDTGYWSRMSTGIISGQEIRIETPNSQAFQAVHNPSITWHIRTPSVLGRSVLDRFRLNVGIIARVVGATHWQDSDTDATALGVAVMYSSTRDTGWVLYLSDGVVRTLTPLNLAMEVSKIYTIVVAITNNTVIATVNGVSATGPLPAGYTGVGLNGELRAFGNTQTAGDRKLDWNAIYGEWDND